MVGTNSEVVQAASRWIPQPRVSGWVAADLAAVQRWEREGSVEAAIEGVGMTESWVGAGAKVNEVAEEMVVEAEVETVTLMVAK